jgi:hypothetical protein
MRRQRLQEGTENQTSAHVIAENLASMTTDAKLTYYNKLFDKHGNQIELTNDQIIMAATKGTTRKEISKRTERTGSSQSPRVMRTRMISRQEREGSPSSQNTSATTMMTAAATTTAQQQQ